jgi:group I intron endonuclease
MYGYIYGLRCRITNKWYIGQTAIEPFKYIKTEYKQQKGRNRTKLYNAIKKYGFDNFDVCLLDSEETKESLDLLECEYIKEYDCISNGYNLQSGGHNGKHSEETKRKLSEMVKGNKNPMFGKVPYNKGIPITEEHRQKLSKLMSGKNHPNYGKVSPRKGKKYPRKIIQEFE